MEDPWHEPWNSANEIGQATGRASRVSDSLKSNFSWRNSTVISDSEVSLESAILSVNDLVMEVCRLNCHGLLSSWQEIIELESVVAEAKKVILAKMHEGASPMTRSDFNGESESSTSTIPSIRQKRHASVVTSSTDDGQAPESLEASDVIGVEGTLPDKESSKLTAEDWERRFKSRQKQIDIGKATSAYKTYSERVMREIRRYDDPHTPRVRDVEKSKRSWKYEVEAWRHKLRKYEASVADQRILIRV